MARFPSLSKPRVGLREIATAAKVCAMTVSLALRDNPRIPTATRERVKRIAVQLGYRPDPELSRLMNHLRASRTARGHVSVALIDFYPTADHAENIYNRDVRAGALRRAAELGFSATTFPAADYDHNLRNLLNVVRARGMEGVLLMPAVMPLSLDPAVNWSGLSVVATSKSILAPRFHSAVPNQFGNMMRVLDALHAAGSQRVCAVFDELFDERTGHNFTAAVRWHHHDRLMLVVPQGSGADERGKRVADWIATHRPDAIFAQSDAIHAALPRLEAARPRLDLRVVSLGAHNSRGFPYLDECVTLIGSASIDLLAAMMYYHETGIPAHPRTTLIDGRLVRVERRRGQNAARLACLPW
jgi:DNA-binding LacI/PurR family transcriptional regulator